MDKKSRIDALLLAAGFSSRAPGFKPLLPLGDFTVIESAIKNFRQAGISDITAVVGHRADELLPVLDGLGVRHVFNAGFAQGMFSSVVAGVRSFGPEVKAFFLLPVDMPLVRSHTVKILERAYSRTGADVIYPFFQGRRGHPPLISMGLAPAILAWNRPEGLRLLLEQYEPKAYDMEVLDEGVQMDIDTSADYRKIVECYCRRHIPTPSECDAIMTKMNASDQVVRHCQLVADVAWRLTDRLKRCGLKLDAGLVLASGLLHDLAKGRPDHACYGARVLKRFGYPKVAEIVASHTDIVFRDGGSLNETAIVYLADKLVQHDRIVSIEERFQCSLEKYSADVDALAAIKGRQEKAKTILKQIEDTLGLKLAEVIAAENPALTVAAER